MNLNFDLKRKKGNEQRHGIEEADGLDKTSECVRV